MKARMIFAAVVAAFAKPHFNDVPQLSAPSVRTAETGGLVSEHTAFRVRTAFERFQRFFGGGG